MVLLAPHESAWFHPLACAMAVASVASDNARTREVQRLRQPSSII